MFYSGICAKVLLYCVHDIYAFWLPKTDILAMFCLHAMSFRRQMAVFYFITSSVMFISCDDSETKANKSQYNDSVSNRICATDLSQCPSDVVCLQESDTHCGSACVDCTLRNEVCSNGACICPDSMLHCNGNACVAESDTACGQSCANCVLNGEICIDGACQCPNNMRHCGEGGQCTDRKSTRLNSSHSHASRMPSSA